MDESERVVRSRADMVMRICMQRLGQYGRDAAEDAFQEVFLVWVRSRPHFRDEEHERRWFARCALDRCRDFARRFKRQSERFAELDEESAGTTGDADTRMDVFAAVAQLKPAYAEAVLLCWGEGMNGAQAAKVLGISHAALRKRLSRAGEELRKILGGTYDGIS
ncbi:MAG: RNA polymerase sigma factor [Clostridia bacterium]|nr:RNA polymerase sigma factor [Clostridia bacterium]